jgi:type IV pilus assembly protein PilC
MMAAYNYKARDSKGASREGSIEAESRDAAAQALRRESLQVVELEEADIGGSLFARRVSRMEIIYVTSQLAIMVDTGINLASALQGIGEQTENPTLRGVLMQLRRSVESGKDFSSALSEFPRYFNRTFVALVRSSERTGSLGTMLEQIAAHMTQEMDSRRKVRTAMAYPAMMLLLAIGVTIFLLTYVMPKFEPLFSRKGVQLPKPTVVVLAISNALINYWWAWAFGLAALIIGYVWAGRTVEGRKFLDGLQLRLPIFGTMSRKVILSRSVRTLGVMVRSGVSMLDAIRLCADVSGNYYYERLWLGVLDEITKGNRICDALRGNPLVPKTLVQMIASGEDTGKLDYVLEKISGHYDKEVEAALKTTTSLIEPIMISVMGVVVGGIGMALMLPIFTLSRAPG